MPPAFGTIIVVPVDPKDESVASEPTFDALVPPEMAERAEALGVAKAQLPALKVFVLAVLAGAFIALGGLFSTITATGGDTLPFGLGRLSAGLSFSLGLVLVVVGGAELFTGNNLMVMAWANRKVGTGALLRNWGIVYLGNFAGALFVALLVFGAGEHLLAQGKFGVLALSMAASKAALPLGAAFTRGVLCNVLVCLAVWLCMSARTTTDKIISVVGPVSAFVAAGFEHSVANMYFLSFGLLVKHAAGPDFWGMVGKMPEDFAELTLSGCALNNLLPVTLGNIVGGAGCVGAVYWFVYLRPRNPET